MSKKACGCQRDHSKYMSFPKRLQTITNVDQVLSHKNTQQIPKIKYLGDQAFCLVCIILTWVETNLYISKKVGNELSHI